MVSRKGIHKVRSNKLCSRINNMEDAYRNYFIDKNYISGSTFVDVEVLKKLPENTLRIDSKLPRKFIDIGKIEINED